MDQTQRCKWVNKQCESDWLQKATFDLDLDPFEARSLILGASSARHVFVETEIERLLEDLVSAFADRDKRLARDAFRQLAAAVKRLARNTLDEKNAEQLVKDAMVRQSLKPRGRGLFGSKGWFRTAGIADARTTA